MTIIPMRYTTAVIILSVIFLLTASAQINRINLSQSFPVLQTGSQLWVGTPAGLYQYNQSDDSYKKFAPPNTRSDFRVKYLFAYKEWLWCVMDSGLAALQTRLNDWLVFDTTNGLPSPVITGVDFQEDYVWVSTPNGAARFDLLIEQWERFDKKRGLPDPHIADLKFDGENIWMLSGNKLSEYSPQFEKWRQFETGGDSLNRANRLFSFGNEIWIVTNRGLVRFNPTLQQRQEFFLPYLASENLCEIYLEGDRMWIVSRSGLFYYENQSGIWTEFEGNASLRELHINFGQITQKQIWVLTEKGTMVWDRDLKTWEKLDYSSGLSLSSYSSVYSDGSLTLLFTPQNIEYRKTLQDPWRKFSIEVTGGAQDIFRRMFDNPDGGSVRLGNYLWNWQGTRVNLIQDYSLHMNGETTSEQSSAWKLDIKSQLELGSGRRITGFYNNIDYTETKYGARYRGNDSDYVREVMWGDFRRDPGAVPFGQTAELFGTNVWLQTGKKTERFKKSLLSLRATAGELRSKKAYENFRGASTLFARTINSRNYIQNQFFSLPVVDSVHRPEELQIFVDDSISGDNNLKTLKGATIGGITGDYDPWIPAEEFYFYPHGVVVRLLKPVMPNWIVIARYRVGSAVMESVLQNGIFSTVQNNFYLLGAQEIMPYSFNLNIKDTLGNSVSLNNFGIDDGSGRIDAKWIDYNFGVLKFPVPVDVSSRYTIEVQGQTERAMIQLEHQNLVRGSEVLRLDDAPAEAGNDFVLDYTNGTLIFVREGIVNPDTRIEIEYEYYESTGNQLVSASLNIAPSDQLYLQGDWQKLSQDSTHLIALHGELRQQVGSFDIRIIPGAVYQTNEQKLTGTSAEALISSKWLRLQSKYEQYDSSYRNIHLNQSIVGNVKNRLNFFSSVDIREDLRLSGEWKQVEGFTKDTNNPQRIIPTDRTGNVSVLYHGADLPAVQMIYQDGQTKIGDSTTSKKFLQGTVEYQIPKSWASAISLQGIKAEYFLRYGRQSDNSTTDLSRQKFLQTYYRLNAVISEQFQAGLFYRRNTLHDVASDQSENPITSSDRLLGDIAFGEWRFMQINAHLENTLQQDFHHGVDSLTYYARQFYQVNTRLSPGQIWQKLSSLFFEITYNQSVSLSDITSASGAPSVWRLAAPDYSGFGLYTLNKNTFVKNEFRPNADWLISTLVEWNNQHAESGSTGLDRSLWQLTEKVDVRPGYTTRLIAQYRRISQDQGFDRTTEIHEPSIWLEQRWTENILSNSQVIYRRTGMEDRVTSALKYEWEGLLDLVFRKDKWLGMHHVEFRQSFSGSHQQQEGIPILRNYRLGATTSLDLYPLYSLIVRLRFDWNRYVDEIVDAGTYSTIGFTLKVSLQL